MKDLFSIDGKRLRLFDFREVLKVILVLSLFHALFLILDIPVDIAFAYCPVFYLYLASRENRQSVSWARIHSHLILLVALMCMTFASEHDLVLLLEACYLFFYSLAINRKLKHSREKAQFYKSDHFIGLGVYFMIITAFLFLITVIEGQIGVVIGFNKLFVFVGMLSLMVVYCLYFLANYLYYQEFALPTEVVKAEVVPKEHSNADDLRKKVAEDINCFFESSDLYLNPNFTLGDLSSALGVSKALVSDVMNGELRVGFYSVLAFYRISHAKNLLLTQEHFTIEALVYQSGFHSKTTFNKYFKQFVGQTPSSFRLKNLAQAPTL